MQTDLKMQTRDYLTFASTSLVIILIAVVGFLWMRNDVKDDQLAESRARIHALDVELLQCKSGR